MPKNWAYFMGSIKTMSENIIMPQLGESIAEGTIVKWLKEPGQSVQKDENVALISTDKVEAEIPSPCAGILQKILVGAGQTVAVGTVIGQVGEGIADLTPPKEEKIEKAKEIPQQAKAIEQPQVQKKEDISSFISPLVKNIAKEHGLSLDEVRNIEGSGRMGRVAKGDILAFIENKPLASKPEISNNSQQREIKKPISTMRRVIMENMLASKRSSAHVTTFFEIDYSAIDKIRASHKERFKKEEGVSLTYTTFLAAAVCETLKRHPYINAVIDKENIIFKQDIHLGIAVAIDTPEPGLMVPVIKNADQINLRGLAHAILDLSSRVRNRKIKPDEISGGTFTITNPGNYGAVVATPIINQPQVAILGVGQIKKQVTVVEVNGQDLIAIRPMGWLSLSFDHRLIDGATADIFMADLKSALENWTQAP